MISSLAFYFSLFTLDWKRLPHRVRCFYGWWWRRTISVICTYSEQGRPFHNCFFTFPSIYLWHPFILSCTLVYPFYLILSPSLSICHSLHLPLSPLIFKLLYYSTPPSPSQPPPPPVCLHSLFFWQEFFFF